MRRTPTPAAAPPVRRRQQTEAPVEHRAQRPCRSSILARRPVGPAGRPAPAQPVEAQGRHPGGGQLDGQGDAVEPAADPSRSGAGRSGTATTSRPSPARSTNSVTASPRASPCRRATARAPGKRTRTAPAAGPGWWPARRPRAAGQQPLDEHGHPVQQVLAVVQHQQRLGAGELGDHRVRRATGRAAHRTRRRLATAAPTIAGVGHRHQVDVPRAVRVPVGRPRSATARASRVLPTPPGPTAVTSRCSAALGERRPLGRPAHERGQRCGRATASRAGPRSGGAGDRRPARPAPGGRPRRACAAARRRGSRRCARTCTAGRRSRAFVRWSPTSASTSASRSETPASVSVRAHPCQRHRVELDSCGRARARRVRPPARTRGRIPR